MAQINVNPSPRTRFQSSPDNISKHRDMIASREFERAADFAMLEYQGHLSTNCATQWDAMANGLKIQGALELLHTLRLLGEQPAKITRMPDLDNLTDSSKPKN